MRRENKEDGSQDNGGEVHRRNNTGRQREANMYKEENRGKNTGNTVRT